MHTRLHLIHRHRTAKQPHAKLEFGLVLLSSVGPVASIPQIIQVYSSRSAEDLSIYTWAIYVVSAIAWLVYGAKLKSVPLVVNNAMWLTVYGAVFTGILLFG